MELPGLSSDTLEVVSRKSFKVLTVSGVKSSGLVMTPGDKMEGRGGRRGKVRKREEGGKEGGEREREKRREKRGGGVEGERGKEGREKEEVNGERIGRRERE